MMKMRGRSRFWRLLVAVLLCCFSVGRAEVARAQGVKGSQEQQRFVVVALDPSPTTEGVLNGLINALRSRGMQVRSVAELERAIEAMQVPTPGQKVHDQFAGYRETIISGIRDYFYMGPNKTVDKLQPVVNLGVQNLEKLAHDPKVAADIYEAASVVLRSYTDLKKPKEAELWARLMAKLFPSTSPSVKTIPKEVGDLVRKEQALLAEQDKTLLQLQLASGKGCEAFINGMPAGAESYALDAADGSKYLIQMECPGEKDVYVWRLPVKAGQTMRVPLVSGNPMVMNMQDASLTTRDKIEQQLHFLRWWSQSDVIIGVSRSALGGESLLMVRIEPGKPAVWSDGADEAALVKLLPRILPELGEQGVVALQEPSAKVVKTGASASSEGSGAVWPWVVGSLGVGVTVFGVGGLVYGFGEAERLRCSPSSRQSGAGCDGVDAYGDLSEVQFNALNSQIERWKLMGWVGLGVGVALVGVGVWGLLSDSGDEAAAVSWELAPTWGGASVTGTWRF